MIEATRRQFLLGGMAAGAVLATPLARRGLATALRSGPSGLGAGRLRKFREPLPAG